MSEQQAEQLMQQMQMLETYFSDLAQREGTFLSILRESIGAIESIKALGAQPDSETLIPLGMGAYIPTKISSNNKIVVILVLAWQSKKIFLQQLIILKPE